MAPLRWIVTGCTNSPFAAELVLAIRERGDLVVATACHSEDLKALKDVGAITLDLNVMHAQDVIDKVMTEAISSLGGLDVLVNCAGYVEVGLIEEVLHDNIMNQLAANVMGPLNTTRSILPTFRKQKAGTIVFMGSLNAVVGAGPLTGAQYALSGIADCLRLETAALGIRTLMVELGWFGTKSFSTPVLVKRSPITISDYVDNADALASMEHAMDDSQPGNPRTIAEQLIDVIKGEGLASGKPWPETLPLGLDAVAKTKEDIGKRLKVCEEYEELIGRTELSASQ